jgi:hypothetical protein
VYGTGTAYAPEVGLHAKHITPGIHMTSPHRCSPSGPTRTGKDELPAPDDESSGYEQPLVAPQLGHAWQDPARCMMSPHT